MIMDKELDAVYDGIDMLFREGHFELVDWILRITDPADVDVCVTLLTTTLPAKSRLPSRGLFFQECRQVHEGVESFEGLA